MFPPIVESLNPTKLSTTAVSLMYREGVSEHQLQHILSTEVSKMKEAIDKDFPNIKIICVTLN